MDGRSVGGVEQAEEDADPAAAFEALRATVEARARALGSEMSLVRRGVDGVFDALDRLGTPADYGADLGRIVQQLGVLSERLTAIEGSQLLRRGPEHYAHVLERSGKDLVQAAVRTLEAQAADLGRLRSDLTLRLAGARERRRQDRWLAGAAALGLLLGVMLTLVLPRMLPGPIDVSVAATVLNADRWNAGANLMQSGNPAGWRWLMEADKLKRANHEALTACAEAAAKAKKEQRCTIIVETH